METVKRFSGRAPLIYAASVAVLVLSITAVVDLFARSAYRTETRAQVASDADALARELSDVIARETAAVETLAAFVDPNARSFRQTAELEAFAGALMQQGRTIRSVQLAPGAVLGFVYPIEGNEAALGLDLLADPDRRSLLEPAIRNHTTVIQGPVKLVQGGVGILVRKPIYEDGGRFWGFAAILLDWPSVVKETGFSEDPALLAGLRLPGSDSVLAGDESAFEQNPVIRVLRVGGTDTVWEIAVRPATGWPGAAANTIAIWLIGAVAAMFAATATFEATRRPEVMRRERQRAVKELAVAEARHLATFENAGVGILVTDLSGRILSVNPAFLGLMGVAHASHLEDRPLQEWVHPDDRQMHRRRLASLARSGTVDTVELRLLSARGIRWCRTRVTLGEGPGGDRIFIGVAEDVTLRRQIEDALAASESLYRSLHQLAPIGIQKEDHSLAQAELTRLARSGDHARELLDRVPGLLERLLALVPVSDRNPAAMALQSHLSGGSKEPTLLDNYSDEARETFITTLVAMLEGETELAISVSAPGADGAPTFLDVRWRAPVVDGVPDYANVLVAISDVTSLRETETRLEELLRSKDRFLASVAHELRTPLTAVVGFAQELQSRRHTESDRDEFVDLIAFHGNEMSHLIEDLLVLARVDIGEVKIAAHQTDLELCVQQTLKLLSGRNPKLEVGGIVEAFADPTRVRQILRNLVTNAIRYGGSDVRVSLRMEGKRAVVDVSDDGAEIPHWEARKMFEPYERTNLNPTLPGSIGLGLTVSRSLARLQDGDLVYERIGDRNVFRLTLPAAAPEGPPAELDSAVDMPVA